MTEVLTQTSKLLLDALRKETALPVRLWGGRVAWIILGETDVWVTRDEDWIVGFYNFSRDPDDEGICVSLYTTALEREDPVAVARKVTRLLSFYIG